MNYRVEVTGELYTQLEYDFTAMPMLPEVGDLLYFGSEVNPHHYKVTKRTFVMNEAPQSSYVQLHVARAGDDETANMPVIG